MNKDHPHATELFDPDKLPALARPLCWRWGIPLEAQRLGLEAYACDLNPVAVLINKAMIEIPPKFAGQAAGQPEDEHRKDLTCTRQWKGAQGLAEDVRRYGHGCGTRRRSALATCIRQSKSRRRWRRPARP